MAAAGVEVGDALDIDKAGKIAIRCRQAGRHEYTGQNEWDEIDGTAPAAVR